MSLINNKLSQIAVLGFLALSIFWVLVHTALHSSDGAIKTFGAIYGLIAMFGGLIGILGARKWGGFKSLVGKSIIFISLGLLAQEFGQLVYAYMTDIQHIDIPYPSVGDIGYFGSVVFYIIGIYYIAKTVSPGLSMKLDKNKLIAFFIPAVTLLATYTYFLRGYEFDWAQPVTVFLDFGYPLGEAAYISIAIVAFLLSRKFLGGVMKRRVLLVLAAFIFQYVADFNFLYQNSHETWTNSGYGDYLYLISYMVMTLSLIYFSTAFTTLNASSKSGIEA